MMNRYPIWKYVLIALVLLVGVIYALPNLYGEDPALQISPARGSKVDAAVEDRVKLALSQAHLSSRAVQLVTGNLLVRFADPETQLKAQDVVQRELGDDYVVALNLAPSTPAWLRFIGAKPMYLGLDLRGGVHFLMQVDMDAVMQQTAERYVEDMRTALRTEKIHYTDIARQGNGVESKFKSADERNAARDALRKQFPELVLTDKDEAGSADLMAVVNEQQQRETRKFAVEQNITTLRNRVNELGVAEPVIQQQGEDRIVVELPGVQDTARAKEILGATATLEFRMVDEEHNPAEAAAGHVPISSRLYHTRKGEPVLLKKRIIITGDSITDAKAGFDSRDGSPNVTITLDGKGARAMFNTTKDNVGKLMAVVFIENKTETHYVDGKAVKTKKRVEEVINRATIREPLSKRFQITGLDSSEEARDLALLLRAGALAAPLDIIEERTVGPSLGQENIDRGFMSCVIGFVVVMVFMSARYKLFGLFASAAQLVNLVLIIAILSLLQATLTLPGIAGIVLTVGMAVDANVLIDERIREELRSGNSPFASIEAGYERALGTIADSNITTLIAGLMLFVLGSGPVKGFAVVLCIGILTSMFTALMGTRALVYLVYGGQRRIEKLAV
jgi:preprotein translocase subunit SecD